MTLELVPDTAQEDPQIDFKAAAKTIYASVTEKAIEEAARLDSVDAEVALLRLWLAESIASEKRDKQLMKALFAQIIRAVNVKYRLSPKRTDDIAAAMRSILNDVGEQIDEDYEEV
jgi:hypothetical protein